VTHFPLGNLSLGGSPAVFRGIIGSAIFGGRNKVGRINALFKTVMGDARQIYNGLRMVI